MWLGKLDLILPRNEASGLLPTPTTQAAHTAPQKKGWKYGFCYFFFPLAHSITKCTFFLMFLSFHNSIAIQCSRIRHTIFYTRLDYVELVFHFKNLTIVFVSKDR